MDHQADPADRLTPQAYRTQIEQIQVQLEHQHRRDAEDLRKRLAENPRQPALYLTLAHTLTALGQHDAAIEILQAACAACPSAPLSAALVQALADCNRTEDAIAAAQAALHVFPNSFLLALKEALVLPILYDSTAHIAHCRDRFTQGLKRVDERLTLEAPEQRRDALEAICHHVNFLLPAQGQDDKQLQEQYAALVQRIMLANVPDWTRAPAASPPRPNRRIRIGYVSAHFHDHSVSRTYVGWLEEHDQEKFEIFSYYVGSETDHVTEQARRASHHFLHSPGDPVRTRSQALSDELDIAVFLDVGMHPVMTQLSTSRLAPVQCAGWGHPMTTGSMAVDYFLSSELMESHESDAHFSERLIRLPGIGVCYHRPLFPRALLDGSRSSIGLGTDRTVYLCGQRPHKYLPQHDDVFPEIAEAVPAAQFVFLSPSDSISRSLKRRLDIAFSKLRLTAEDHCLVLPERGRMDYWNLNLASDVFLDSFEWSGFNTTMEAAACGLPVVTVPGRFMRGRHGHAILTQLEVPDTIARDKADYVAIATRLGRNRAWRRQIAGRMQTNRDRLYSDRRSVTALEQFYRDVLRDRP
jgi:protein O-GlcNAc transferase